MTETARLAHALYYHSHLTWAECADAADRLADNGDHRYEAVAAWCRVAARQGTVDLDRQ